MSRNDESPLVVNGEILEGFHRIAGIAVDLGGVPLRPTRRCLRCGAWLRVPRETDGDVPERQYCATCEARQRRNMKLCASCDEVFFAEDEKAVRCPECEAKFQKRKRVCQSCGAEFLPYACGACQDNHTHQALCHACHWRKFHAEEAACRERICRLCGCSFLPQPCPVPGCVGKPKDVCSVCHEEQAHDGLRAEVWTLANCSRCHQAVEALRRLHRKVMLHDLEKLRSGEESDCDALVALSLADDVAPLVKVQGRFLDVGEIDELIENGRLPEGVR